MVETAPMEKTRRMLVAVVVGIGVWLAGPGYTGAAERDLYAGLASLRAGAQSQAEQHLTRYRDEERDPEIRRNLDRVLPLLKAPLSAEMREYIAVTLEESVRSAPKIQVSSRPSYWLRMFPVFP